MIKMIPSFLLLSASFLTLVASAGVAQVGVTPAQTEPAIADIQIVPEGEDIQQVPAPQTAGDVPVVTTPPADAAPTPTITPESVVTVTDVPPATPAPINPDIAVAPVDSGAVAPSLVLPVVMGTPVEKEINEQVMFQNPGIDPNSMPSLFFSIWEHDLIVDARKTLNTRPPEDGNAPENNAVAIDSPREVILGGIVYVSSKEWTIWLNNTRVTPTAIPNEVMDLKVYKDHIELEWFDATNNQIFPIRLRTKQRFNLDTRMFLPG